MFCQTQIPSTPRQNQLEGAGFKSKSPEDSMDTKQLGMNFLSQQSTQQL